MAIKSSFERSYDKQNINLVVILYEIYILEQSVSVRAVPELSVREAGAAVEFFHKASSPFCMPVARQYQSV